MKKKSHLDFDDITFGSRDDKDNVRKNFLLPLNNPNGTSVSWANSYPSVAIDGGNAGYSCVSSDTPETLTATITKGAVSDKKTFDITVKQSEACEIIASDEAILGLIDITFYNGDSYFQM